MKRSVRELYLNGSGLFNVLTSRKLICSGFKRLVAFQAPPRPAPGIQSPQFWKPRAKNPQQSKNQKNFLGSLLVFPAPIYPAGPNLFRENDAFSPPLVTPAGLALELVAFFLC